MRPVLSAIRLGLSYRLHTRLCRSPTGSRPRPPQTCTRGQGRPGPAPAAGLPSLTRGHCGFLGFVLQPPGAVFAEPMSVPSPHLDVSLAGQAVLSKVTRGCEDSPHRPRSGALRVPRLAPATCKSPPLGLAKPPLPLLRFIFCSLSEAASMGRPSPPPPRCRPASPLLAPFSAGTPAPVPASPPRSRKSFTAALCC